MEEFSLASFATAMCVFIRGWLKGGKYTGELIERRHVREVCVCVARVCCLVGLISGVVVLFIVCSFLDSKSEVFIFILCFLFDFPYIYRCELL